MNATSAFTLEVSQNPCLPPDGDEMHVILTVTAEGLGAYTPTVAEVILVDSSGSMAERITRTPAATRTSDTRIGTAGDHPRTKIAAARRASAAAIDALRDGALFAIVAGTHRAEMVYPPRAELAVATPETRAAAKRAVTRMTDHGGTAIGTWLTRARALFDTRPATIRHVILLTDGRDESERRADLDAALTACEGRFSCDARGIGDGWASDEGAAHRRSPRRRGRRRTRRFRTRSRLPGDDPDGDGQGRVRRARRRTDAAGRGRAPDEAGPADRA
ncbi:hypothetical protein GCM10029978_042230 [Actinoallomurus acanthiterrae]